MKVTDRSLRGLLLLLVVPLLFLQSCAGHTSRGGADALLIQTAPISSLRAIHPTPGGEIRILTTTSFVHEVVSSVAGGDLQVQRLLPLGVDPHSFEPTPRDLRALADADVLFINGLGLESFLGETLRSAGGEAIVISLSEGIEPLQFGGASHGGGDSGGEGGPDPHVWLDPVLMTRWAQNAAQALAAIDPAHAEAYASRGRAYQEMLGALNDWILVQIEPIPLQERVLVTDHEALGYFAARYRFQVIGTIVPAYSSAAEPSAQGLASLERIVEQTNAKAVFVSADVNPRTAALLASDMGLHLVRLYLGSLSVPSGPAATYRQLMEYNVEAVVKALTEG
jgi:ABC-type Zn uptake system ZnuABC Zn-binding protein ZnuA